MRGVLKATGFLLPLLIVGTTGLHGQKITSSILGQVTDTSGAAVPGAQVMVRNSGTGISIRATTDSSGTYSVPDLLAGTYDVSASKEGFQGYMRTGVGLLASQTVRVDIALRVGALQQSVNVSAPAPLVQTDSATISGSLSIRQMTELPFAYQSIGDMLNLLPSFQRSPGNYNNPYLAGAAYEGGTNFTLNGVSQNDSYNGGSAYAYAVGSQAFVNLPGISSLQEFKVEDVNINAEYRNQAAVTMVSKQGTNQFHGSLYEFVQNTKLNANTFLSNATGVPKAPVQINQFGGDIGGPIRKNKAFFFFNFDGLRQRQPITSQSSFATAAMRNGDFSALCASYDGNGVCNSPVSADPNISSTQLYNPFTGNPFPRNQIPASMFAPQVKTLLTFLPAPTLPGALGTPGEVPNYTGTVSQAQDRDSYLTRIDYQLSPSDTLYGVYTHNTGLPWSYAYSGIPNYGNFAYVAHKTQSIAVSETRNFGPTTTNDIRVSWFEHRQWYAGQNLNFDPRSLFPQLTPSANRGLPTMSFAGYAGLYDLGLFPAQPRPVVQITDNFTHVKGRHTIRAGIDESGYKAFFPNPDAPLGSFYSSGQWTGNHGWPGRPTSQGNGFADFLLGVADSSSTGTLGVDTSMYTRDWEFYGQDTWQASPRLTVYYGLRYMYETPWTIRDNERTFVDLANNKLALPENSLTPTLPAVGASPALYTAFAPFFETTKAIGLPINYLVPDKNNWAPRVGFAFRPFSGTGTVLRGGYGVYYAFKASGYGYRDDNYNPPWGSTSLNYSTQLPGQPTTPFLPDITFQNPFPSGNVGPVAAANPGLSMTQRDIKNAVAQQWSLTLEHQFAQNWSVRASYIGSQTHHMSWYGSDINVPVTQQPNVPIQQQRPLQPWSSISTIRSGAKQNLNQLQLEAVKRFSSGFSFQAEYQWTKSLGNMLGQWSGPQNWHFPNQDYGDNSYILRHRLVANYIYELPVGRGKKWLSASNPVLNGALGGWQVSGITMYETGFPTSVNIELPNGFVGWWGGRADRVAGAPLYAGQQHSHDIISGVQWFNPAAFAPPKPWAWGNSAQDIIFGPGAWNWDISAAKNFKVPRTERHSLQFRADFFDALNHFSLGTPSAGIADVRDGGLVDSTSGKVFTGSGNRTIQLGLKYTF